MGMVQHYKGAIELPVSPELAAEVEKGAALLRKTMTSYGVSQEAADSFAFGYKPYSLTISAEEGWSGAFHTFADGKPFYEVSITAPGSMFDIASGVPLPQQKPQQQAALVGFEIGMNLISRVEQAIAIKFGLEQDSRAGGTSSTIGPIDYSTSTAREPAIFFAALNDLLDMRLGMLTPKLATELKTGGESKPARAPKPPGM